MNHLYLAINLLSLSLPLLFAMLFKLEMVKEWKRFMVSTIVIAIPFLIWDSIFTTHGIWGFNSDYHMGILLFHLPIEEILFFFCIPFASLFIHFSLEKYKPSMVLNIALTKWLTLLFLILLIIALSIYRNQIYTVVNYTILVLSLTVGLIWYREKLQRFYISFIVILIPFFIVNGILTGSFIQDEVVWYNANEIIGIRLFTIPIEDIGYAFSMLFLNVILFENLLREKRLDP